MFARESSMRVSIVDRGTDDDDVDYYICKRLQSSKTGGLCYRLGQNLRAQNLPSGAEAEPLIMGL